MVIAKFNNTFLDNLIQVVPNSKFKEKESLNYLIIERKLLIIIPIIFKKEPLITKSFKTIEQWQNYIDNEFEKWVLKNNINKIIIKLDDKPDLIIILNDEEIGMELTYVFPFPKKLRAGDVFKNHQSKQREVKNNIKQELKNLKLEEKIPRIKILENNKVSFPKTFTNLKEKKIIEDAIIQVKNLDKITPASVSPFIFICDCNKIDHTEKLIVFIFVTESLGSNQENQLNINNFELNLIDAIKDKSEKCEKYYKTKVEKNVLLILVEELSHFLVWTVSARDGFSDICYYGVKNECCIKHYFNRVYSNVEKERNNFDQTIIIYENNNAIKDICILK